MDGEQQAIFVYYENDRRKFKMVMKGDISKLPVEKIKRYLTSATGLPRDQQILSYEGHVLTDDLIGEDFGLVANATLTLVAGSGQSQLPPPSSSTRGPGGAAAAPVSASPHGPGAQMQYQPQPISPAPSQPVVGVNRNLYDEPPQYGSYAAGSSALAPSNRYPPVTSTNTTLNTVKSSAVSEPAGGVANTSAMLSRNTALEEENMKLRHELQAARREQDALRRTNRPGDNVLASAKANLVELGNELGLHLSFDANLTCVVGSEEKNTILVTFDPATERLYLYSTVLTYLPEDAAMRLRLYEALLEGALLGRDMAGGGVGISVQSGLVMMSTTVDLRHSDAFALRDITPRFVEALVRWRSVVSDLLVQGPLAPGSEFAPPSRAPPPPPPSQSYGAPSQFSSSHLYHR